MRFHRDGYLGPLPLAASLLTPAARRLLTETVNGHGTRSRHLDSRLVFELCTDPAVLATITAILGADLLLWGSAFVVSGPWHQDLHCWPAALSVTAWLALTDTDEASGCLEVLPGSHRAVLPVPAAVTEPSGRPIPMPAGHFAVLSDRVLHRSALANAWALAARFTTPNVHVPHQQCLLVSGSDRFGVNQLGLPPPARHRHQPLLW